MAYEFAMQVKSALNNNYLTDSKYVRGTYHVVATTSERDALVVDSGNGGVVVEGSLCYCQADDKLYMYNGSSWAEFEVGGGGVSSINGQTGDLTNIAKTNVDNNFPHTTFTGSLEINSDGSAWNEGIRIHPSSNDWSGIVFCEKSNSGSTNSSTNTWSIHNHEGAFGFFKNGSSTSGAPMYIANNGGDWLIKDSTSSGYILHSGNIASYLNSITYNGSFS